jgi:hypothetical protein
MRAFAVAIVSALAALSSAYTIPDEPNYNESPTGNAIALPGLNEQVPAGAPYTITWDPTTTGTIDLILLRGPSTNVVPIATIAQDIANTGTFVWTPSTSLVPDTTHYGILLVVTATGQYQYSTQFGISNPEYSVSSSSASATTSSAPAPSGSSSASGVTTEPVVLTTTICPETASPTLVGTGGATVPVSSPTTVPTYPSTLRSTGVSATAASTTTSAPLFTGAAGRNAVSFGAVAVGVAAVLAF